MTAAFSGDRWRGRRGLVTFALAVLVGVVAAGITWGVVASEKAKYQSIATLAIDQPRAIAASGDAGVVSKLASLRFKYAGLVTTQVFATPVGQGLGVNPTAVRAALFARTPTNSLLLQVGAQGGRAHSVQTLANAAANELVTYVQDEQQKASIPSDQRFTFSVVTPAGGASKTSPTTKKVAGAAGLAGLIGFVVVFAAMSLRDRDDV